MGNAPQPNAGVPGSYYPSEGDWTVIPLRLQSIRQLFNSLDASPFLEQDLDDDAEAFIISALDELENKKNVKIAVYLPVHEVEHARQAVPAALANHFCYRADRERASLRRHLRQSRRALFFGSVFLVLCMTIAVSLGRLGAQSQNNGQAILFSVIEEGLIILGWVALWRPFEMLFYDWWPQLEQRRLFSRASHIPVEVRSSGDSRGAEPSPSSRGGDPMALQRGSQHQDTR